MSAEAAVFSLQLRNPRDTRSDLSVFSQDWWLNIARTSSNYRELKIVRRNHVAGQLAFVLSKNKLGLVCGQDPYWSHIGGPILDEGLDRAEQADVIRSLLRQLPRWVSFCFVCDPNVCYAELVRNAFRDAGFRHSTQITYVRFPQEGEVLNPRKSKHRGHIKRAARSLECVDISPKEFVEFLEVNLRAGGKKSYAPLEVLPHLIQEAITRGCARAIAARPNTKDGRCVPYDAAIIYLWDRSRCYYWLSTHRIICGQDPGVKPHPDAVKLLVVKAMEHAQAMNLTFDVDGIATPGADNLYRHVLGLKNQQKRDVFERINILERLYRKSRHRFVQTNSSPLLD